jgi:iron complex transport system permease protein
MHGRRGAARADGNGTITVDRLRARWVVIAVCCALGAALLGITVGPVSIAPHRVVLEILDHVPGIDVDSGLSTSHAAIVWEIRAP